MHIEKLLRKTHNFFVGIKNGLCPMGGGGSESYSHIRNTRITHRYSVHLHTNTLCINTPILCALTHQYSVH